MAKCSNGKIPNATRLLKLADDMCGIAGLVGEFRPGLIAAMNAAQEHRGPDGSGIFESADQQIGLGHVRLSILDLSDAASQPMHSACGRYTLVFNGEIYNFRELRVELEKRDAAPFRSTGDSEVLLRGLIHEGADFVKRLNGIFAFAFWDSKLGSLLLARDHLGVKPLYLSDLGDGRLLFASELKAILRHPSVSKDIDPIALQQHLTFCHACGNRTMFSAVRRLPAGCTLQWDRQRRTARTSEYWSPTYSGANTSLQENVERLQGMLSGAVERQMVSDAPVGTFLSGGLDSTLITSIASKHVDSMQAFTTTASSGQALDGMDDDTPYARQVAQSLGLRHNEIPLNAEFADLLPRLIYLMDEPIVDPAIINCYLVSQRAAELGVKVLLSGQGADELFGGYPRYKAMNIAKRFDMLPRWTRRSLSQAAHLLPGAMAGRFGPTVRRTRRVLSELQFDADHRFLRYCAQTPPDFVSTLLQPELAQDFSPLDDCMSVLDGKTGDNRFLHRDTSVYLPNHNLMYTDKMGMATGVETRVPLLDIELVELSNAMPFEWKVSGRDLKSVLRTASRGIVSDDILDRKKAGFGAPFRGWLRNELSDLWNDVASPKSVASRGWFQPEAVAKVRNDSQSGRSDYYLLQWAIITLELWARAFLDE